MGEWSSNHCELPVCYVHTLWHLIVSQQLSCGWVKCSLREVLQENKPVVVKVFVIIELFFLQLTDTNHALLCGVLCVKNRLVCARFDHVVEWCILKCVECGADNCGVTDVVAVDNLLHESVGFIGHTWVSDSDLSVAWAVLSELLLHLNRHANFREVKGNISIDCFSECRFTFECW